MIHFTTFCNSFEQAGTNNLECEKTLLYNNTNTAINNI